jgi:large repetitive protein
MDRRYSCAILVLLLLAFVQISGCGGGGSKVAPLVISTSSLPNGTVGTQYSSLLRASGGTPPYTWSQTSGGDMPTGITLGSTGNFVGTPTQPGTFGPYTFTVTDSASVTASTAGLSITINSSTLTINTTSLPNAVLGTAYSTTLSVSGGTPPYTWTQASGGDLPAGLSPITSGGVIAGTPTTVGSYGPYTFTVTDSNSATATTGDLPLTVTSAASSVCAPSGNEAALSSSTPYAFLLKGTDSNGNPIDIAGSFTPNGAGGITNAIADYNGFTSGPEPLKVDVAASSYSFSSKAQGCLYLSFSGLVTGDDAKSASKPAVAGHARTIAKPQTAAIPVSNAQFSFYLSSLNAGVYQTGRIIEADNTSGKGTSASGFIHVQLPSAFTLSSLQPNYAFGVDGWTIAAPANLRTALAGSFTNSSGTLSSIYADLNQGGTASGEITGGYGTLINSSIDPTTGRGTGSIYLTSPTGKITFDFAFYVLNGSDMILLSTDQAQNGSTTPLLCGRALASSASYSSAPLNGYYLLAAQGYQTLGIALGNIAQIGTFNATSAGTIPTATIYSNYAGTYLSNQYTGITYSVEAASGRASIVGLTTNPPVAYLTAGSSSDDEIAAFAVGTDPQSSSGVIVSQTAGAPSYSVGSVTGNYASSTGEDIDGSNGAFLGGFSFTGSGAYTVTSQTTGSLTNVPTAGSISINSDGSGNLDGGKFPLVTNGQVIFAIPDSGDPLLYVFTAATL